MLQQWWLDRMATTHDAAAGEAHALLARALRDRRTTRSRDMLLMYQQNALFRADGDGQLPRPRARRCRCSPRCSSGSTTTRTSRAQPNENFARELMELFTLGVEPVHARTTSSRRRGRGPGHNTLDDDREQYHFYPTRHDNGMKTFMGVTQNWDGPDIIDFILRTDATHKQIAAALHRQEDVDVLRVPEPRHDVARRDLAARSSPPTSRSTTLVRAIFMHPSSSRPTAQAGARALPGRVGRRVHARRWA